jgi:hypothetical protein
MNVVGKLKQRHRQVKKEIEAQKKLSVIPESPIKGIGGLPIELWSLVIEHMVVEQLGDSHLQCWEMFRILQSRLVCSKSNPLTPSECILTINQGSSTKKSNTASTSTSNSRKFHVLRSCPP